MEQTITISTHFQYKDLVFLSLQAPVTLSQDINLQKDFNSKYSNGEIYIYDNFQYQISNLVFSSLDSPILQYSIQIKQGKNLWIYLKVIGSLNEISNKKEQFGVSSSQYNQEGASLSARLKKASVFAKSANQQIEFLQNQSVSISMKENSKVQDENQPSFSRNDIKFIELNEQDTNFYEEKQNESKTMKIESEAVKEQLKKSQQIDYKPQQVNDQSFVDSFDQSKLGMLNDQIAN
ncbi:hypothetical protein ABPG72_016211 [Tetrahymena utriculariae]